MWCKWTRNASSSPGWCVEPGHEFSVGGAGGGEVFVAFVELLSKVEVVLFELADALVECVDVGGGAESGLAPGVFAECFGESLSRVGGCGRRDGRRVRGRLAGRPVVRRG